MDNNLKKYRKKGIVTFRTKDQQFWDWLEKEYEKFVQDKPAGDTSAKPANFFRVKFMESYETEAVLTAAK